MIDVLGPEKRRRRTTQEQIAVWLRKEDEEGFQRCPDIVLQQPASYFSGVSNTRKEVLLLSPPENRLFLPLNLLPP